VPELISLERLQPSLLDRLTDDEPSQRRESREQRFFNVRRLRQSVLRDLGWLLNTTRQPAGSEIDRYDEASRSTLNFGVPELAGISASTVDVEQLAQCVKEAVLRFEPRILREGLSVKVTADAETMGANTLTMRIEGDLWAVPAPLRILVNTCFDLESGRVVVADAAATR